MSDHPDDPKGDTPESFGGTDYPEVPPAAPMARRAWAMRFELATSATPEVSSLLLKYIGKHPVPWKAEASSIVDARGVVFMVIDGDGYEERWALAQLFVLLINKVRL